MRGEEELGLGTVARSISLASLLVWFAHGCFLLDPLQALPLLESLTGPHIKFLGP